MDAAGSPARRDALYFVVGPLLFTLAASTAFNIRPWAVPIPSQAQVLQPAPVAAILVLGLLGALFSGRAGLPSAPDIRDTAQWRRLLAVAVGSGMLFGVFLF